MDNLEKEAIEYLIKNHCDISKTTNVLDVGCNKGTWLDIILNYKDSSQYHATYRLHIFEPNEMLLNYLKVKYDYKENITYCNRACYRESDKELTFYYWEDYHNGLSSVYNNPKWEQELGDKRKEKKVRTISLDDYWLKDDLS